MGKSEDRISNLPEQVLQSILTMMPLKSAITTDVLSKKWRNLWKYSLSTTTSLEFGEDLSNHLSAKEYVESVNRYLSLNHTKKLEKFSILFCPFDLFSSDIHKWISFATDRCVRYLDIDLSQGFIDPQDGEFTDGRTPFDLPSSLFDCDSLIELSLSRCNFITPLNLNNFGCLKSLSICHSNINEEMLQSILTECSLLESLSIRSCQQLVVISINVPDLNLKRLTIGDSWSADLVDIHAPKLQSFHYFGGLCVETNFSNISSLEDALIHSIGRDLEHDYMDLLSSISHVRILTICKATLVHLNLGGQDYDDDFRIELRNLQELQLLMTSMTDEDLACFWNFFGICSYPLLEKLFIRRLSQDKCMAHTTYSVSRINKINGLHVMEDVEEQSPLPGDKVLNMLISNVQTSLVEPLPKHIDDPNEEKYGVTVPNPRNLDNTTFDHLKVIKLTNFKGSSNEMRLVSFLLQKAAILETMVLVLPTVKEGNGEERLVLRILRGQVSLLPKASTSAQIILHEFGEDDGLNPTHMEILDDYSYLPLIPHMVVG